MTQVSLDVCCDLLLDHLNSCDKCKLGSQNCQLNEKLWLQAQEHLDYRIFLDWQGRLSKMYSLLENYK